MKKICLNVYIWSCFLAVTLLGLILLPVILAVDMVFSPRRLDSATRRAIRFYGWVLVCVVPFFAPVRVINSGREVVSPVIVVANHNSALDPFLLGAIVCENSFVTSWPFAIPVYRFFMHLAGYANASKGWQEIRTKGQALLARGSSVTIWPEGHRSRTGLLGRFKKGAFLLSVETGVPVVPVCIVGSGKVLPPGEKLLRPGRIKLVVLSPIYPPASGDAHQDALLLSNTARTKIEETLAQHGHFDGVSVS